MRTDEAARESVIMANRNGFGAMMDTMAADRATYNPYLDGVIRTSVLGLERGRPTTFRAWKERLISKRMLEFMQGITMFASRDDEDDHIGRPPYHRQASCGPSTREPAVSAAFERDNLTCRPDTPDPELSRRRRNVWTCLIERLAYRSVYQSLIGPQDIGHDHNEARVTRSLFERCFAASSVTVIDVSVALTGRTGVPVEMTVTYSTPLDRIVETYSRMRPSSAETYELDVAVHGRKTVRPLGGPYGYGPGDEYNRIQSYYSEPGDWLPVSPGRPPLNGGGGCVDRGRRAAGWTPNRPQGAVEPWNCSAAAPEAGKKRQHEQGLHGPGCLTRGYP